MSGAVGINLTYSQRHALDRLVQRSPRSISHGLGSRTMAALRRLGLVEVRVVRRDQFGVHFDWRATVAGSHEMRRYRRALARPFKGPPR